LKGNQYEESLAELAVNYQKSLEGYK
jgi:hypothetical protein